MGSCLAGSGLSRSNNGPVALCTLGLGLLNPPPLMVGKSSTSLTGWGVFTCVGWQVTLCDPIMASDTP